MTCDRSTASEYYETHRQNMPESIKFGDAA